MEEEFKEENHLIHTPNVFGIEALPSFRKKTKSPNASTPSFTKKDKSVTDQEEPEGISK